MGVFEFSYRSPVVPDVLYVDGPLIAVSVSAHVELLDILRTQGLPKFPVHTGLALLDTGASTSAVDVSVFRSLGIPAVDRTTAQTVHGIADMDTFNASASFPELALFDLPLERVIGGHIRASTELGPDVIMLIGRDILRDWRFTYDGPTSRFTIGV